MQNKSTAKKTPQIDLNKVTIQILEDSMNQENSLFFHLPSTIFVINKDLQLVKFNKNFLDFVNRELDEMYQVQFEDFLKPYEYKEIKNLIEEKLRFPRNEERVNFSISGKHLSWHCKSVSNAGSIYYAFIGFDLEQEIKSSQRLKNLYQSLEASIITIDTEGIIEDSYSKHINKLVSEPHIIGKNFFDIFFQPNWLNLDELTKNQINNLHSCFNRNSFWFEAIKDELPTQYHFVDPTKKIDKFLGLKYQPLYEDSSIQKILILIEDRTKIVRMEEESKKKIEIKEKNLARILQIKKNNPKNLPILSAEFDRGMKSLIDLIKVQDYKSLSPVLHSIKGNAFVAGLDFLSAKANEAEDLIEKRMNWDAVEKACFAVIKEYEELKPLILAMTPDRLEASEDLQRVKNLWNQYSNALRGDKELINQIHTEQFAFLLNNMNTFESSHYKTIIKEQAKSLEKETQKTVLVDFSANDVSIPEELRSVIGRFILHSLNNAFLHGIESPIDRETAGKSETGIINISFKKSEGRIKVSVEDDGRGVDPKKVRNLIAEKGLLTLEKSLKMSDERIIQYITHPGLTTQKEVSHLAGRGVGLDRTQIEKLGGVVKVESQSGRGTLIEASLPSHQLKVFKKAVTLRDICKNIDQVFGNNSKKKIQSETGPMEYKELKGITFIDEMKLLTSISIINSAYHDDLTQWDFDIRLTHQDKFLLQSTCQINPIERKPNTEFSKVSELCKNIIIDHSGSVFADETKTLLSFGPILLEKDLPKIYLYTPREFYNLIPPKLKSCLETTFEEAGIQYEIVHELPGTRFVLKINDGPFTKISKHLEDDQIREIILEELTRVLGFE